MSLPDYDDGGMVETVTEAPAKKSDPAFDPPWRDVGNGIQVRPAYTNTMVCRECGSHWVDKRGVHIVCGECGSHRMDWVG